MKIGGVVSAFGWRSAEIHPCGVRAANEEDYDRAIRRRELGQERLRRDGNHLVPEGTDAIGDRSRRLVLADEERLHDRLL